MPTFFATEDAIIYEAPDPTGRIAENGGARLPVGTTFTGQAVQNNMVHVETGIGFVAKSATRGPCMTYQVSTEAQIHEQPNQASPIAEGGTALRHPGDRLDATPETDQWLWVTTGIGFILKASVRSLHDAPATYPGVGRIHIVQPGESLSSLAVFYYHDEARWPDIANANQLTDPSLILDGQRLIIP